DARRALALMRLSMVDAYRENIADRAKALVAIEPSEPLACVAAEMLESHYAGTVLRPWCAAHPELAIAALADRVESEKKTPFAASSLLQTLVRGHRAIAEAAQKKRPRDALASALDVSKPVPDAEPSELPPALAAPPWRAPPQKKSAPVAYASFE